MRIVPPVVFLLFAAQAAPLFAQPANTSCATAQDLCAQQPVAGNNTGATGIPGFCPNTNAVLWYSFTTNSVGGVVEVALSNINCLNSPGVGDMMNVVVLAGDGSCLPGSFSGVSPCNGTDSLPFTVTTTSLAPNTTYWILVSGSLAGGATSPAQCGFTVEVSGPGANIVGVDFSAGPDQTIGQGEVTQLNATGGTTYQWSPTVGLSGNTIPDPFAQPNETTTYTVTTVLNGCEYSDQVTVEVIRRVMPPTAITPNGDGKNDTWAIAGIIDYPYCEVHIYDRWGQPVFRSTGYRDPWDGTNNGRTLPIGTYYYVIELNQVEGKSPPYTGFVSIIR